MTVSKDYTASNQPIDLVSEFQKRQNRNRKSSAMMEHIFNLFKRDVDSSDRRYQAIGDDLYELFAHTAEMKTDIPVYGRRNCDRGQVSSYKYALEFWIKAMGRLIRECPAEALASAASTQRYLFESHLLYNDLKTAVFGSVIASIPRGLEDDSSQIFRALELLEGVLMNTAVNIEDPVMNDLFNEAGERWMDLMKGLDIRQRIGRFQFLEFWNDHDGDHIPELDDLLAPLKEERDVYDQESSPSVAETSPITSLPGQSGLRLVVSNP